MLQDEKHDVKNQAIKILNEIETKSGLRRFSSPKLNFDGEKYYEIIDLSKNCCITSILNSQGKFVLEEV